MFPVFLSSPLSLSHHFPLPVSLSLPFLGLFVLLSIDVFFSICLSPLSLALSRSHSTFLSHPTLSLNHTFPVSLTLSLPPCLSHSFFLHPLSLPVFSLSLSLSFSLSHLLCISPFALLSIDLFLSPPPSFSLTFPVSLPLSPPFQSLPHLPIFL
ncbi:hypothetical protein NQD34_001427 [Periophthalmus magnuspinnatus]|nr:hypothetical protein NQD34_001427 [Periophthalmus magnuspinnatus]